MSHHDKSQSRCDHEISEIVEDETTSDSVLSCCDCDKVLAVPRAELPQHWFDHEPTVIENVKLAEDILGGSLFESQESRFIHICGACGHWLGAVHGEWFEKFDSYRDINSIESAFTANLEESLCPACGAACFAHGSLVAPLNDARSLRQTYNVTRYVFNRADKAIWEGAEFTTQHMENELYDHGYLARCPACGFAEQYGNSDREFDFHHWDYENDVGCYLCRECHNHIHNNQRAKEQTKETGQEWQYDAVSRLLSLSKEMVCAFVVGWVSQYDIISHLRQ